MIIGLTGIYGSGKSTIAKMFKEYGDFEIIDADKIGHEVLKEKKDEVVKLLGKRILDNNQINRQKVANIVFTNKEKLEQLDELTHPRINEVIKLMASTKKKVLIDIALIVEADLINFCDKVVLVRCNKQEERLDVNISEIKRRINAQLSEEKLKDISDIVIDNNGTVDDARKQVKKICKELN